MKTNSLCTQEDGQVFLKLESEGPTGSFKVRGAYQAVDVCQKQSNGKLPGVVTRQHRKSRRRCRLCGIYTLTIRFSASFLHTQGSDCR